MTNATPWHEVYPPAYVIERASLQTLISWDQGLPPPRDPFQQVLRERIKERAIKLAGQEFKKHGENEVVEGWNAVADILEKLGGNVPRM